MRILCTACKGQYPAQDVDLRALGLPIDTPLNLSGGAGCAECGNLCYKGRTGVFEIMVMTDAVRELVLQRKPAGVIMEAAAADGMRTLRDATVRKVLDGVTSIDELHRLMIVETA